MHKLAKASTPKSGDADQAGADDGFSLKALQEKREHLKHRVDLLSPDNADPDLVSELIRQNLDVVHPDEKVIILDKPAPQGE